MSILKVFIILPAFKKQDLQLSISQEVLNLEAYILKLMQLKLMGTEETQYVLARVNEACQSAGLQTCLRMCLPLGLGFKPFNILTLM